PDHDVRAVAAGEVRIAGEVVDAVVGDDDALAGRDAVGLVRLRRVGAGGADVAQRFGLDQRVRLGAALGRVARGGTRRCDARGRAAPQDLPDVHLGVGNDLLDVRVPGQALHLGCRKVRCDRV